MNQSTRAYYLDWIRIGVILLLVPFHSAVSFTRMGDAFIKYQQSALAMDIGLVFLSIWIMPVLFMVSGAASYYALQHKTPKEYARERRTKLLKPFIAATLLVCAPLSYLRALFIGSFHGSFLQFYPLFFTNGAYPRGNFNWGHLWFLVYLFVFTLILRPFFVRMTVERASARLVAASSILEKGLWIYIVVIPSMFTETLLRPFFPGLQNLFWDWANFTLYLVLVFYGFVFAMNDRILDNIERIRTFSLVLAIFLFVVAAYLRLSGMGPVMGRMFPAFKALMVFAWVFAVLGYAKRYLNRQGRFYKYLNNASFPFYIFHYVPITVAAYFIARSDLNVWLKWVVIIVLAYPSTFALYEIVKRIPVLRFLFGVKPGRQGFS
ncbi:MAG: acyltransferase family protein [Syntrophobacteraceae bacterium]